MSMTQGHFAIVMGDWPDTIKRTRHYFEERWGLVDCRGTIEIAATAHFGFQVTILTASHRYDPETTLAEVFLRTVRIDDGAWVASRALLYNCHIQHHAIVGAGSVVKNAVVPPYTLVEGNPAVAVSTYVDGRWQELQEPQKLKGF